MDKLLRHVSVLTFLVLISLPFNNCSPAQTASTSVNTSTLPTNALLSIAVGGASPLTIPPTQQTFTISGSCSVSEYPNSAIDWQMTTSQLTYDSYMAAGGASPNPYLSTCVNGSFSITVRVPCPGAINNANNTVCTGLNQSWSFVVRLYGETISGTQSASAIVASSPITLNP